MEPKILNQETTNVAIDLITEHPRNPNQAEVERIIDSIETDGFYGTIIVQRSTGYIIAGNHRYRAAVKAGFKTVPVTYLDVDDAKANRILVKDNRIAEFGTRNEELLSELLREIEEDSGLHGTGFTDEDFNNMFTQFDTDQAVRPGGDGQEENEDQIDQKPLNEIDVLLEEPSIIPESKSVWRLGNSFLVVGSVFDDWELYTPLLTPGARLLPYPNHLIPFYEHYATASLVMIQPDTYLAGCLLENHKASTKNEPELVS